MPSLSSVGMGVKYAMIVGKALMVYTKSRRGAGYYIKSGQSIVLQAWTTIHRECGVLKRC